MTQSENSVFDRAPLPPLGEVLDFMRLIWSVDHALQRASKRMEKTLGVTGPQRFVIRIVGRFPGMPAGDLARLLHIHPSTLTGILARLERSGLIRRRPDPRDGRRSLLGLTEEGRRLDVVTDGTVEAAVARVLEDKSSDTLRAAREVLRSVAAALASPSIPSLQASRERAAFTMRSRRT
jgi:DNA-binding MarR family transcriptional regulator